MDDFQTDQAAVTDFETVSDSGAPEADASEAITPEAGVRETAETPAPLAEPADTPFDTAAETQSEPYIGRWNRLISTTNWEKGRIIHQWREALIASEADAAEYSDEAWTRLVGGVTAPHVGRLRRVYARFGDEHESYPGLFWSHFLAALDWDDAPLWLEGAVREGWTVGRMREMRWEASGRPAEQEPKASDIVASDTDEDGVGVEPAQGGGRATRKEDEPGEIYAGPIPEGPDFGEEPTGGDPAAAGATADRIGAPEADESAPLAQPFAGLPEFPDDLAEALEMFKLAILRHKADGWRDVAQADVLRAVEGLSILARQPAE